MRCQTLPREDVKVVTSPVFAVPATVFPHAIAANIVSPVTVVNEVPVPLVTLEKVLCWFSATVLTSPNGMSYSHRMPGYAKDPRLALVIAMLLDIRKVWLPPYMTA